MAGNGFDLGNLGDIVGDIVGGKGFDVAALGPLWEQIQPTLKGLDTSAILDTIGTWANDLDLPLISNIPDSVIDDLKNGAKVPLEKIVKGN
jgi:hypothetical protein